MCFLSVLLVPLVSAGWWAGECVPASSAAGTHSENGLVSLHRQTRLNVFNVHQDTQKGQKESKTLTSCFITQTVFIAFADVRAAWRQLNNVPGVCPG